EHTSLHLVVSASQSSNGRPFMVERALARNCHASRARHFKAPWPPAAAAEQRPQFPMARVVPHDEHDWEPISPELAMIDPELARRHASMQPVWDTLNAAEEAEPEAPEHRDRVVGTVRRRKPRRLLLAAAAVVAGAGALVPLTLVKFSDDSRRAAAPTAPSKPFVGYASTKQVRPRPQVSRSAPARP